MKRIGKLAAAVLGASLLTAGAAQATVLVFDDFESYGPTSILNFNAFNDLNVTGGTVDFVHEPEFGLSTPFGFGMVDLDGSTNDAGRLGTAFFAFAAGDILTLDFDASGNQRGGAFDQLDFGLTFAGIGMGSVANVFVISPQGNQGPLGPFAGFTSIFSLRNLAPTDPWGHYSFSVQAVTAGSVSAFVRNTGTDNVGPLVDNFRFSLTAAVPEPATWAMMILGFGLAGSVLRRRVALA